MAFQIHVDAATRAHGVSAFLPWHRYYVWKLEEELLKIDSRVVIPYWDWSLDSQAPEVSIIFLDSLFGGNGRANDSCVTNGRFKDWKVAYPNPSCLKRNFDGGSKLSAFYATEQMDLLVQGSGTYDAFRQALEGAPHGTPHNNIGGFMATMHSSNDPIFWLHHGFIDKLWHDFQSRQGKRRLYSAKSNLQENLPPFDVTVD
ncbi:putative, di-copper centre domain-containing protein [Rozella allomycis CSF55]|uniref:Putative, di-copper centre domain-containing protein n=1 Tax=Rozella allomycis (strain CSF55) TaxID=988480 RepID=A0A075AU36_ROZAC|nr:putative, di-copper centre domain-containing protein [Rozella allomycis CSF55]|eukprot:EPZ33650.1 putative, di-copper centre domain-containing protein [Rozella allomycis CSF55]